MTPIEILRQVVRNLATSANFPPGMLRRLPPMDLLDIGPAPKIHPLGNGTYHPMMWFDPPYHSTPATSAASATTTDSDL